MEKEADGYKTGGMLGAVGSYHRLQLKTFTCNVFKTSFGSNYFKCQLTKILPEATNL